MFRNSVLLLLLACASNIYADVVQPTSAVSAASSIASVKVVDVTPASAVKLAPAMSITQPAPTAANDHYVSGKITAGSAQSALQPAQPEQAVQQPQSAPEQVQPPVQPKRKTRPALPGIDTLRGKLNTKLSHANVISVSGDGTTNALVSSRFPNRIATPFAHPKIIDASSVVIQIDGSNIFLSPKTEEPFAIYITGDGPGDQVISLTLLPKEIPAQTLILQLDADSSGRHATKPEGYTEQLVDLLRQVGSGKIPEGYSEGRMPNMMAKQEGLTIVPEVRYSGSWLDVYRYRVENNQSATIELSETQFYQKGVKAVAITPNVILQQGDATTVYVVADKSVLDQADSNGK